MAEILRNAAVVLILILLGIVAWAVLGDDPRALPFAYEGQDSR